MISTGGHGEIRPAFRFFATLIGRGVWETPGRTVIRSGRRSLPLPRGCGWRRGRLPYRRAECSEGGLRRTSPDAKRTGTVTAVTDLVTRIAGLTSKSR